MNCGLCGGGDAAPFLEAGGHRLVKCSGCGLVYTGDFDPGKAGYKEDYFAAKNRYIERWDEFCSIFDALIEKVRAFKPGGKLLDVGAGVGALLTAAKKRGFEARGVEFSAWAAAFARDEKGLDVLTGTLETSGLSPETFDVAVINHVLEHAEAPLELLAEARRVLRADGLLVVGVPNIGSIMAGLQGENWPSLKPEEHRWHFTPETLGALLARAEFEVVFFEAGENYPAAGWGPRSLFRRFINGVSVLCDRSEAMILFAGKKAGPAAGGAKGPGA